MNPEEIKVGDKINIESLVIRKLHSEEQLITCELPTGLQFHIWQRDFEALSPANGIKYTEPAPKYDPCRKFREGDIVEPCSVKGRWLSEAWKNRKGIHYEVTSDEDDDCVMWVQDADSLHPKDVEAVFFQLVTPIEELEPYSVVDAHTHWDVADKNMKTVATYSKGYHPHAKEAAEAECARLNEAYRKEVEK